MEYNVLMVNNYINILSNQNLMQMFSEEELYKMKAIVKNFVSKELAITPQTENVMSQFK